VPSIEEDFEMVRRALNKPVFGREHAALSRIEAEVERLRLESSQYHASLIEAEQREAGLLNTIKLLRTETVQERLDETWNAAFEDDGIVLDEPTIYLPRVTTIIGQTLAAFEAGKVWAGEEVERLRACDNEHVEEIERLRAERDAFKKTSDHYLEAYDAACDGLNKYGKEVERLREELEGWKEGITLGPVNLIKENERLRDVISFEKQQGAAWADEVERLRNLYDQADLARAQLERRVTRLRKAVNWLRGALHDEVCRTSGSTRSVDECGTWECQRARAVLEEEAE
jgi:DNA repair exonuclease SbcCD ATPase subunit